MSHNNRCHGATANNPAETVLCIDADCPACGWPERTLTLPAGVFGCPKCTHTSAERGA